MKTKLMKPNISRFLGILAVIIKEILHYKTKTSEEYIKKYFEFIDKCKVENFDELDEETYDLIKQAIKEYNKTGDIKKDFIKKFGIDAWNDMKVKY